jgi:hypothetical protein
VEYEIKRIPLGPVIKVMFFVFLVTGFILGIFYGMLLINLISAMSQSLPIDSQLVKEFSGMGTAGIIMTGIIMSLFTSVIFTSLCAIMAASYNVFAGWLGGIKMNLESPELDNVLYEEVEYEDSSRIAN